VQYIWVTWNKFAYIRIHSHTFVHIRIHSHVMSLTHFLFGFELSNSLLVFPSLSLSSHSLLVSPSLSLVSLFSLCSALNRMLHFRTISLFQILNNQKLKPYFMCRYFYAWMPTFNILKSSFRYLKKLNNLYFDFFEGKKN